MLYHLIKKLKLLEGGQLYSFKLSSTSMAGKDFPPVAISINSCPIMRWHDLLVTGFMISLDAQYRNLEVPIIFCVII